MPAAEPPGGAPPPPAAHVDVDAFPLIAMPPPMPPAGPVLPPANVQAAANNNPAAMNAEEATMLPFKDQLAHHRALRIADARAGTLHVRAAGVTFDGRQGNLEDAREREENGRKQALLAVREPDNPHDGNAVRLETPDGRSIGYVPRAALHAYDPQHEAAAAEVASVGAARANGLLGASVWLLPELPALTVELLPAEMAARVDEARAQAGALAAGGAVCAITGAPAAEVALVDVPVFRLEKFLRRVVLLGWATVAAPIATAKRPDLLHTPEGREAAAVLVAEINRWGVADARGHFGAAEAMRARIEAEGWELVMQ